MPAVELREVDADNVRDVCRLKLAPEQEKFVAPTANTLAEARYYEGARVKAIYADDELVGLAAWEFEDGEWYIWRLMVDAGHQRRGHGRAAVEQICELVRAEGASEVLTSYVPGDGSPGAFYVKAGFEETGREEHGERVMRRGL